MPFRRDRETSSVQRILVATDRSDTADRAVEWSAEMSERYGAELLVLEVRPEGDSGGDEELQRLAEELAGVRGRAKVVAGEDPSQAIVDAAEAEDVDVVVVGNLGMSGRREFLLGNVPNRVSHLSRRTVVIVNTAGEPRRKRRWP